MSEADNENDIARFTKYNIAEPELSIVNNASFGVIMPSYSSSVQFLSFVRFSLHYGMACFVPFLCRL